MGDVSGDSGVVFLFFYLLPGFLGSTAYSFLVEGDRGDTYQRVVHALALTLVSALIVHAVLGVPLVPTITVTKDTPITTILTAMLSEGILYTSLVALALAILLAILNNHGLLYAVARWLRVTYRTSNADVWQDTFYKYQRYWVCVRFSDGRSLVGWPQYYSPIGKPRELFVAEATWWKRAEDGTPFPTDVHGPGVYIADFSKIEAIELLE